MLTITCALVMIKDIIFHRMGRIQCFLFYKTRKLFQRRGTGSIEEFRLWYFEERFRNFRACVLNNDLLHDFTGTSNFNYSPSLQPFCSQCSIYLFLEVALVYLIL